MRWTLGKRQWLQLPVQDAPQQLQMSLLVGVQQPEVEIRRVHSATARVNATSDRTLLNSVPKRMVRAGDSGLDEATR
jgi:hypothetical protein